MIKVNPKSRELVRAWLYLYTGWVAACLGEIPEGDAVRPYIEGTLERFLKEFGFEERKDK